MASDYNSGRRIAGFPPKKIFLAEPSPVCHNFFCSIIDIKIMKKGPAVELDGLQNDRCQKHFLPVPRKNTLECFQPLCLPFSALHCSQVNLIIYKHRWAQKSYFVTRYGCPLVTGRFWKVMSNKERVMSLMTWFCTVAVEVTLYNLAETVM